jgi:hypothetical protein
VTTGNGTPAVRSLSLCRQSYSGSFVSPGEWKRNVVTQSCSRLDMHSLIFVFMGFKFCVSYEIGTSSKDISQYSLVQWAMDAAGCQEYDLNVGFCLVRASSWAGRTGICTITRPSVPLPEGYVTRSDTQQRVQLCIKAASYCGQN